MDHSFAIKVISKTFALISPDKDDWYLRFKVDAVKLDGSVFFSTLDGKTIGVVDRSAFFLHFVEVCDD